MEPLARDIQVSETDGFATVDVARRGSLHGPATVHYHLIGGTAVQAMDFRFVSPGPANPKMIHSCHKLEAQSQKYLCQF